MTKNEGLQERFGDSIRHGIATQAKAFKDYGNLLDRLATRDLKLVQFARDSADLYIGTMGAFASTGAQLVESVMKSGIQGFDKAASEAVDAVDEAVKSASVRTKASADKPAPKKKRALKKKAAKVSASS